METIITFIAGVFTGIISQYYGTRLSDKAKNRDVINERKKLFEKAYNQMPKLLKQMKSNFEHSSNREFFILPSKGIIFNAVNYIAYYQDEHEDLKSKIGFLEDESFIKDITETSTPKYRISNEFSELLKTMKL
ncbi:MAG: hypothetical protein MH472_07415 [Bacteroidia bacterium]|nr:hypothetical protein [Bacteroidia bacterium]